MPDVNGEIDVDEDFPWGTFVINAPQFKLIVVTHSQLDCGLCATPARLQNPPTSVVFSIANKITGVHAPLVVCLSCYRDMDRSIGELVQ